MIVKRLYIVSPAIVHVAMSGFQHSVDAVMKRGGRAGS